MTDPFPALITVGPPGTDPRAAAAAAGAAAAALALRLDDDRIGALNVAQGTDPGAFADALTGAAVAIIRTLTDDEPIIQAQIVERLRGLAQTWADTLAHMPDPPRKKRPRKGRKHG